MKKALVFISLLLCAFALYGRIVERTYVSTDRSCYVAGDDIWMSAFCMDSSEGRPSSFSSIAYVELCSSDGVVQTAKIALVDGRGAGRMTIPRNTPTGNYRLVAYTALNRNEQGYDYMSCASTLSVYNTFSSSRVSGGVEVCEEVPLAPQAERGGTGISLVVPDYLRCSDKALFSLANSSKDDMDLSVSVYLEDGLPAPCGMDICDFLSSSRFEGVPSFTQDFIPEYEGEIIYGRVVGGTAASCNGKYAFISATGDLTGAYSSAVEGGRAVFFTNNIYGDRDIICQIEGLGPEDDCHLDIESPFVAPQATDVPVLRIGRNMESALSRRSAAMQIEHSFASDTLYSMLPYRQNLVFSDNKKKTYMLDDFRRFPLMSEIIVEFIKELRTRKSDGRTDIQVLLEDFKKASYFTDGTSLMLLDGTPVFDHSKIMEYDPLLVEYIDIYQDTYFFGSRTFDGVVNFVTYKRNLPSIQFDSNVRLLGFKGCCWPMAYTCSGIGGDYPDYRQTAYWHPCVKIAAGASEPVEVRFPSTPGRYMVKIEGTTASGSPVLIRRIVEAK